MKLTDSTLDLTGGEIQRLKPCHDCPASYNDSYSGRNPVTVLIQAAKTMGPHKCHHAPGAACAQNLLLGPKGNCIAQDFVYDGMVKVGK